MKGISIKEPYASMILFGEKTIETRTWKTNHRGDIVVCASKKPISPISGFAVCVVNLIDCRPMVPSDEKKACCEMYSGAYSWVLGTARKIEMLPVKGRLGLFNIDNSMIKEIDAQ